MARSFEIRAENGVESLLRIVGILKRKRFDIKNVNMEHVEGMASSLMITLGDDSEYAPEYAMKHVKKLFGISEIKEIKGEN